MARRKSGGRKLKCPKCGKSVKKDEFCSHCGGKLESASPKAASTLLPNNIPPILIVLVFAFIVALGLAYLAFTGYFQTETQLSASFELSDAACGEEVTYLIELKDDRGQPLERQPVSIHADEVLLETLITDQNGRISSTRDVTPEWCGEEVTFTVFYEGDPFHGPVHAESIQKIMIPTEITLVVPSEAVANEEFVITATLTNAVDGTALRSRSVVFSVDSQIITETTDTQGKAAPNIVLTETGTEKISVEFTGDSSYVSSESLSETITIVPQTCEDGTVVGECSTKTTSYYCEEGKTLVFDCERCGCLPEFVCYESECITEAARKERLVQKLLDQIVYVEHSFGSGSGIILEHRSGETIILTNRHVVEGADSVYDLTITTNDDVTVHADDVKVAPNGMDLAVIYVSGQKGEVADIVSSDYGKGAEVLALGSPLGLQGSVAEGIVSNFMQDYTDSYYMYNAIQTDAAVNPGNSGGGLFLKTTGELIGVNTFILTETEGLNFAIDISELDEITSYSAWQTFTPVPKCDDGTPYGSCSSSYIGAYCSNGNLINNCQWCGCPDDYPYCQTEGYDAGICFTCGPGYEGYGDGGCCRTGYDYYGDGVCCPPGYTAFEDGACCPPGYYSGGDGYCYPY